jgi:hypothetical protein
MSPSCDLIENPYANFFDSISATGSTSTLLLQKLEIAQFYPASNGYSPYASQGNKELRTTSHEYP